MADSERDPRTDPRPGDVLRGKKWLGGHGATRRFVTRIEAHYVFYECGAALWQCFATRTEWRKWSATAEVVRRAE